MGYRDSKIAASIVKALFSLGGGNSTFLSRLFAFFRIFDLVLVRYEPERFRKLRQTIWKINDDEYQECFSKDNGHDVRVRAVGDLGYSGSTFFETDDSKYLIKSLPRWSEYNFFMSEMIVPYFQHMTSHPLSLLVRITDFLHAPQSYLGGLLRITPSHHIIMENILFGKQQDRLGDKWETYDLKPVSYFYPERDIAGGHLASNAVKERLLDTFEDKIRMYEYQKNHLIEQLQEDCKLLEECNVVDYSLFIVRFPYMTDDGGGRYIPELSDRASPWRSGTPSSDNKWIYRAIVLDFFWAKHKIHAQTMTGLVTGYNLISSKGHMSITTTPADYRERFLKMVDALFEVTA